MRKLAWFAVGFAAACAAGAYLVSGMWLLLLGIFCLFGGIPLLFVHTKYSKLAGLILCGCAVSFGWFWVFDTFYLNTARQYDGKSVVATVELTDYGSETGYGVSADGKLELNGKTYRIRAYLAGDVHVSPGDTVTGRVRLRQNDRGTDTLFNGYVEADAVLETAETLPIKYYPAKLRHDIMNLLDRLFPTDTLGFARALLLGDSRALTYSQNTAFSVSGIRHIVAVSGLHVSILFSVIYLVTGRRRYLTGLLGIPVLILFAAVAGFTPSVVRACIMQGLMSVALMLNREYDPPSALAAAVLTMLAVNPMSIVSVSLQLSVACMIGIFLFADPIRRYILRGKPEKLAKGKTALAKSIRFLANSISVTLSAMITTTPLCAWYFGTVSILGVLTNILTLWAISFAFYGIMAACAAGAFWQPLGRVIAWVVSWPIRYVLTVSEVVASFPLAAVYTASIYIVLWLVFSYVLLGIHLLSKKKRPVILSACMVAGLIIALAASCLEPGLDPYRVTVLDVGQGQCILFQCGGDSYLVDCGGDSDETVADDAAGLLLSQGITKLDGVFLTHYDRDHGGALANLLTRVDAEKLYMPDIAAKGTIRQDLEAEYSEIIQLVREDTRLREPNCTVTLFAATEDTGDNESCLCILFRTENCDILITGDRGIAGEAELLTHGSLPELELLVVGHHGAKNATGTDLLVETMPNTAVISVGADNNYGHPSQETLEKLSRFCKRVWRTDLHGTILFRG